MNMEFDFTVLTQHPALVVYQTYDVFWLDQLSAMPMSIGKCKVRLSGNEIFCNARLSNGDITHFTNDVVIAHFTFNDVLLGKYDYCTLLKTNNDNEDELMGFGLMAKEILT